MSQVRLGKITKSRKWKAVVALISDGEGPLDDDVALTEQIEREIDEWVAGLYGL